MMYRYLRFLLLNGVFAFELFSCTDPATDFKEGGGVVVDSAELNPPLTPYPTDTTTMPVIADTTTIRR